MFETPEYTFLVIVANGEGHLEALVEFDSQRAGAENLFKEGINDVGLAAHPSRRWMINANCSQVVMLAYNLKRRLLLFNRDEDATVEQVPHTALATARLRFLFLAAKIWRHAGRVGVSCSDHYEEKGLSERLIDPLRRITGASADLLRWWRLQCDVDEHAYIN